MTGKRGQLTTSGCEPCCILVVCSLGWYEGGIGELAVWDYIREKVMALEGLGDGHSWFSGRFGARVRLCRGCLVALHVALGQPFAAGSQGWFAFAI